MKMKKNYLIKYVIVILMTAFNTSVFSQSNTDCNGVVNGSSMMDSCGVCQQSYIYDFVTHTVTMIDDTMSVTLGATEILVMANDPQNPYWNGIPIFSFDTIVSNDIIFWNGIYLTSSGDYSDTLISTNGYCDSIANLNFTLDNTTLIMDDKVNSKVVKIIDIIGRETSPKQNSILFYIRKDGQVEKRIIIDNKY